MTYTKEEKVAYHGRPLTAKLGEFPLRSAREERERQLQPPNRDGGGQKPIQQPQEITVTIQQNDRLPRKQKEHKRAIPRYLTMLHERTSTREVAELLGVSDGSISEAVRTADCSFTLEVAAKGVWNELYAVKDGKPRQMAIIEHDENSLQFIKNMVQSTNGKFTQL